jgi:hypothetical protein
MFLGLAGAAFVVLMVARYHWHQLNSKDMGTMSRQWLANYNAQHP